MRTWLSGNARFGTIVNETFMNCPYLRERFELGPVVMAKVTPQLIVDLIKTFPRECLDAAERDLFGLTIPPYADLNCKVRSQTLPEPIGLLEYALRFGRPASVDLLLQAGADPNAGVPRPLTVLTMAQACRDDGRLEKLEALLQAGARADYVETAGNFPPTPLIALARSKCAGIQRYWIARLLRAAGASPRTTNDYELRVVARLLAELRAIDEILDCLSPAEQEATKTEPTSFAGLVATVLRSAHPLALDRMISAGKEAKLPLEFDPTAALREISMQIADHPVSPGQAGFVRRLLEAGAEMQSPPDGDSAFERALAFENHELVEIFLDGGAKPTRASAPDLVFELMRRQGLAQRPKAPAVEKRKPPPTGALDSLDLLCSGVAALEACPESDLHRLTAAHSAALQSLAERLFAVARRVAPVTTKYTRRRSDRAPAGPGQPDQRHQASAAALSTSSS
jgi:ankyrin repeat protein